MFPVICFMATALLNLCNIDDGILESLVTLSKKLLHACFLYPALHTVLHKLCSLDGGNCVVLVQGSDLPAEGGRWERGEG